MKYYYKPLRRWLTVLRRDGQRLRLALDYGWIEVTCAR